MEYMKPNKYNEIELNEQFDVWSRKDSRYRVFVQSSLSAHRLNQYLGYPYGREADFIKSSSEGIFTFEGSKLDAVLNILKL
jgi:hypothetical protein